ncbi:hypothetical protein U1Q18_013722 [Sarracenia purpurea var. burkii]
MNGTSTNPTTATLKKELNGNHIHIYRHIHIIRRERTMGIFYKIPKVTRKRENVGNTGNLARRRTPLRNTFFNPFSSVHQTASTHKHDEQESILSQLFIPLTHNHQL